MQSSTVEVTDANFQEVVQGFSGVVLVDFWAAWCGPCRMVAPIIEQLAQKYVGNEKVRVAKMDIDANQATAMKLQILSIPSLKIFRDGELVDETVGVTPGTVLESKIQKALENK